MRGGHEGRAVLPPMCSVAPSLSGCSCPWSSASVRHTNSPHMWELLTWAPPQRTSPLLPIGPLPLVLSLPADPPAGCFPILRAAELGP